jgi:uncharacterized protein HemX
MEMMQPIEGVTPGMLWIALIVLIAGASLYVLYGKVRETRSKLKTMNDPQGKLAEEISTKVLESLEPRFAEIDRKLSNDKAVIDSHTRQIDALSSRTDGSEDGIKALSRGVLALLNHALHNGNNDELEKAQQGINEYLIQK